MSKFHIATEEEIRQGKVTDLYFTTALKILRKRGINPIVKMEFTAKSFPAGWQWAIFAGVEEVVSLALKLNVKVRAIQEGQVFYPYEPVLEIEGRYQQFCIYETPILGFISQASGIATQSARFRRLAGDRIVASFGARRMHPAIAPMIERNAFIGGCDGVSVIKSAELIEQEPMGTIPHALILVVGSTVEALKMYDEILPPKVKRVALIDTFLDEKFECLNAARALGKKLFAVRFDTPSSRRGDFYQLIREARWELDREGFSHVKIFVSGGIKEQDIIKLNPVVDAYGIGTAISNSPTIDFSADIVEIDGKPIAKRGKWSGAKRLLECRKCGSRKIIPANTGRRNIKCSCGGETIDLLKNVISNCKYLAKPQKPSEIRQKVLKRIKKLRVDLSESG